MGFLLNRSQFAEQQADSDRLGRLTRIYHQEHKTLEPRTLTNWDHNETRCNICHDPQRKLNHPSILPPE